MVLRTAAPKATTAAAKAPSRQEPKRANGSAWTDVAVLAHRQGSNGTAAADRSETTKEDT
ncbi:hypothetical protein GCM10009783_40420 [Glycomyces lechevalierae]